MIPPEWLGIRRTSLAEHEYYEIVGADGPFVILQCCECGKSSYLVEGIDYPMNKLSRELLRLLDEPY